MIRRRFCGCAGRGAAEPAVDRRRGHAASQSPTGRRGGDAVARSGGAAAADCQRDGAGHRLLRAQGALAARMPTVAVWGTGIDVVYPKENKKLAEEILAMGGAIVSEVPMGTFPAPQNFPRRNRILSGLSVAVLVVEAGENSGTRVTARCAAEQNRDLFAVPGNVTSKGSWTPNTLIKQGAKLVATWEDVWEDLPSQVRLELEADAPLESKSDTTASLLPDPVLRPEEAIVLEVLRTDESLQIDEILELLETQLTSSEVFTALFELEITGRVRCLPGKNYVRTLWVSDEWRSASRAPVGMHRVGFPRYPYSSSLWRTKRFAFQVARRPEMYLRAFRSDAGKSCVLENGTAEGKKVSRGVETGWCSVVGCIICGWFFPGMGKQPRSRQDS